MDRNRLEFWVKDVNSWLAFTERTAALQVAGFQTLALGKPCATPPPPPGVSDGSLFLYVTKPDNIYTQRQTITSCFNKTLMFWNEYYTINLSSKLEKHPYNTMRRIKIERKVQKDSKITIYSFKSEYKK